MRVDQMPTAGAKLLTVKYEKNGKVRKGFLLEINFERRTRFDTTSAMRTLETRTMLIQDQKTGKIVSVDYNNSYWEPELER